MYIPSNKSQQTILISHVQWNSNELQRCWRLQIEMNIISQEVAYNKADISDCIYRIIAVL